MKNLDNIVSANPTRSVRKVVFLIAGALLILVSQQGCSPASTDRAHFTGSVSVDPAVDSVRDYSGFSIRVGSFDDPEAQLFSVATDSTGSFSGSFKIARRGFHPVTLSRYGRDLSRFRVLFAEGDTVRMDAMFPISDSTLTISSNEQSVFGTYERIERNFARVTAFIQAGVLSEDSVKLELLKWSDLYWDLHSTHPETYAGDMAALRSIVLLQGVNDSLMQARYKASVNISEALLPEGAIHMAFWNEARGDDDEAVRIFEQALKKSTLARVKRDLYQAYTRLLYSLDRPEQGERVLNRMARELASDSLALAWKDAWTPEFTTLRPGAPLPEFSWVAGGDTLSSSDYLGAPLLIEFVRYSSPYYQQVYDRHLIVAQLFEETGLKFVTIADDHTPARFNTFLEERLQLWSFVSDPLESIEQVHSRYNIQAVPSWVLVDSEGKIRRKFIGREIEGLIPQLQALSASE